ncbi:unnamed protein product [Mytilus coruscus]|uniref:Fe2OG dioxygenase domain-containing protein n=1 Tax=Mytilus coruscus TaxID=42192 RepID=A0A6J8AX49_MYTCO|nr:unnamed protein product [Mytilus coruscus]
MNTLYIPVIDFQAYALGQDCPVADLDKLGSEMCKALEDIGFCYLKNHGISQDVINDAFSSSRRFFMQPEEEKEKFARSKSKHFNFGWVGKEGEKLNGPDHPGDYKETWNVTMNKQEDYSGEWPSHFPELKSSMEILWEKGTELSLKVFDVIAYGLNLEDKQFFRKCHKLIGTPNNKSLLRSLFYPEIPADYEIKEGQLRCGEHTDYGPLTLLFQDDVGGLEVRNRDGQFVPATPIPGTILVNIGDILQRWTADKLMATKHRILMPSANMERGQTRQSIAFFTFSDDDVMIECLDKSNRYEPIKSIDYLNSKFSLTY